MKQTEEKTNVMRTLDRLHISYDVHHPGDSVTALSGVEIANRLHQSPDRIFKTLVTTGHSGKHYVFVIPVAAELDLKKAAKAVGEKSVQMIHVKEINQLTGYIRGGCSPIGMKKQFPTVLSDSAKELSSVIISGGRIGFQIDLKPDDLLGLIRGKYGDIEVQE